MHPKILIPETDLGPLSPLGLGTTHAGLKWDGPDADRIFDCFLDLGGNVIDTARVYSDWVKPEIGRSERVIGDWLSRSGKRREVILLTKGGHPDMTVPSPDLHRSRLSRQDMCHDVDASLKSLRTDCIDIYLYHRDDTSIPVAELVETMQDFVRAGKIRYYGCSNWTVPRMKEADAYCRAKGYRGFVGNEALYNLGYRHMKPLSDDTLCYVDTEMQAYHLNNPRCLVIPYMGICNGFFQKYLNQGPSAVEGSPYYTKGNLRAADALKKLAEKHNTGIAQAVLGFFSVQPFSCLALYGPRNPENLKEAASAFDIPFTAEEYAEVLGA